MTKHDKKPDPAKKKTGEESPKKKHRKPKWNHTSSQNEVDALRTMRRKKKKKDKPDESESDER